MGFRAFVARHVESTTARGWVRNVGRSTVEAVVHGAPDVIAGLEPHLRTGPINARVDHVDVSDGSLADEHRGFTIERSVKE